MVALKCECIICGSDNEIEVSKRIREELGKGILYICIECSQKAKMSGLPKETELLLTFEKERLNKALKGTL